MYPSAFILYAPTCIHVHPLHNDCHNIIMAPKNVNDMQLDERTDSGIIDGQEIVVVEDCMSSSGRRRISMISSQEEGLADDISYAHSCPPLTCPLQALASHQKTTPNTMAVDIKYPLFTTTAFAMSSSPSVTSSFVISPNTKALNSMQQIINLNQSAINHSLSGGNNDDWAFDTLHKAEWPSGYVVI